MPIIRLAALLGLTWLGMPAQAQVTDPALKGPLERRSLFSPDAAKVWQCAESTVDASTVHVKDGAPALHWHVTVDYHTGEPQYPVGWPRTSRGFTVEPSRELSGWDYLHAWVFTESSRAELPRAAVGVNIKVSGGSPDDHRLLSGLRPGTWTEVLLPISELTESASLERVQFSLSESNYRHGDTLDLYVNDLALLRYTAPTLQSFTAESAVMFADRAQLPVKVQLAGLKAGATCELVCELRRGAETVTRVTTQAERGVQRLSLDLKGKQPAAGDYDLVATVTGNPQPATARVRLVESPWR